MTEQNKIAPVMPLNAGEERKNAPVAVFDSGVGGIAVLRALRAQLPGEDLLYFGDSANAPYGEKGSEAVLALVMRHAARLLARAKALVLACNTATAVAAAALRRCYTGVPIIGMEPALRPALSLGAHPGVLVMATPVTLSEGKFAALLRSCEGRGEILPVPAPDIVRLVEQGEENSPRMATYLEKLLAPYCHVRPDAVVLGCTHFCFARTAISRTVGGDIPIFDGVEGTVREVERRLGSAGLLQEEGRTGSVTLTSSDHHALALYARLRGEQ